MDKADKVKVVGTFLVPSPRIQANLEERTARRSVPATFVGCVSMLTFERKPSKAGWFLRLAIEEWKPMAGTLDCIRSKGPKSLLQ